MKLIKLLLFGAVAFPALSAIAETAPAKEPTSTPTPPILQDMLGTTIPYTPSVKPPSEIPAPRPLATIAAEHHPESNHGDKIE